MDFANFLFIFLELMVVINCSYSIDPQKCEAPEIKNGRFKPENFTKGVRYSCLEGFTLFGAKSSYCDKGQWNRPMPICIKPGCPQVPDIENGSTMNEEATTTLICNEGYSVAGNEKTFCNGTAWDRSLGSCRKDQTSPSMSCDFEVDSICGWEPYTTPDLEWERKNGYTSVKQTQTGPKYDHTVGVPLDGHFMLATFTGQSPNSVARILSPIYSAAASKGACFRFYSHMYGAITGVLRIYVKPKSITITEMMESSKYLRMEKNGSDVNAWLKSVVEIDKCDEEFQIIIEAKENRTSRSNIAIDDVALLSGAECTAEESKSTTEGTISTEDDGIYDAQSCVDRCQETSSHSPYVTDTTITSSNKTVNILQCDCFDGCEDLGSCCLDYESYCVFDNDDDDDSGGGTINPIIKDFTEFQVMLGVFGVILLLAMMSSIVITLSKYFCKASLKDRGDKITFLLAEEQSDFKMEVASDDDDMKL